MWVELLFIIGKLNIIIINVNVDVIERWIKVFLLIDFLNLVNVKLIAVVDAV